MRSNVLAPYWVFYYFQIVGLHSVRGKRSSIFYYHIALLAATIIFSFMAIKLHLMKYNSGSITDLVGMAESNFQYLNY